MLREGSLPSTCHVLHVMCQVSHVMCHFFFLFGGILIDIGIQWTQENMMSIAEAGFFYVQIRERAVFIIGFGELSQESAWPSVSLAAPATWPVKVRVARSLMDSGCFIPLPKCNKCPILSSCVEGLLSTELL